MHYIVKNIAVNTACIHQVQKCAQISSNILFSIKMISCSTLINYVNSIHSFVVHFDNICASYLDFWRWYFLLVGTVYFFAIPSELLNSIVIERFSNHLSKVIFWNINRNHLSSYFSQQTSPRSFSIFLDSANTIKTTLIKFHYMWGTDK